ncbi:MAG: hypothetical protein IKY58_01950 [Paludibacteraceae bacterium]|nr:hypothetical protein [Paludibacteraceae bacterium]
MEIPKDVREFGHYAFYGCENLDVVINNSSNLIYRDFAFDGCKSVTW